MISAPATSPDVTVVLGVNFDEAYDPASAHDHLQRLLHHQLPGTGRQGSAGDGRDQARPDDDDPRLHGRSAPAGHAAQGPAPRACRRRQPDPRHHRRRQGDRAGDPGAEREAQRLCGARARPDRQRRRPDDRGRARDHQGGDQRGAKAAAGDGPLKGYLEYTEDPIVSPTSSATRRRRSSIPS